MSRRARRRKAARAPRRKPAGGRSRKPAGRSWWPWIVIGLLVVAVVVMTGGYFALRAWLHSEDFRRMLSEQAGEGLDAHAEFGAFHWDGTAVETESFAADGAGVVERIEAEGLGMDIGLGRVRQGIVEIRDAKIRRVGVRFRLDGAAQSTPDPGAAEGAVEAPQAPASPAWYDRFLPKEVVLGGIELGESTVVLGLADGDLAFSGTRWDIEPGSGRGAYRALGSGGVVRFPWEKLPPLEMGESRLRYRDGVVFLTDSDFGVYRRGHLNLTGEASVEGGPVAFDGRLRGVTGGDVLPEDWKRRLEGDIEADFSLRAGDRDLLVDGTLRLLNGRLTGLPVLDKLGAYSGIERFRRLNLSELRTDFRWEGGALEFSDFVLASEGLVRMEGRLRVGADESLDGRFRLGMVPGTLSRIPGAETKVFQPGERGLLWAPLRIGGTLDDPEEDLSGRLIEAAGWRMFEILPETGERVLKFTRQAVGDEVIGILGQPDEVIRRGGDVVRQGSDVLDRGREVLDGEFDGAADVIRQGGEVVDGVRGLFDVLGGGGGEVPDATQFKRRTWTANLLLAKQTFVALQRQPAERFDELDDHADLRYHSADGGRRDWIYRSGGLGSIAGRRVLLVSPEAVDGERIVLFDNGSVQGVAEATVQGLAGMSGEQSD